MDNKDEELRRIEAQKSVDDLADSIMELAKICAKAFPYHTPEQREILDMLDTFRKYKVWGFYKSTIYASNYKKVRLDFLD